MRAAEFEIEQRYLIERRRLINRTVIGWGVVGGLQVTSDGHTATVSRGLALDRFGREIDLLESMEIGKDNTFLLSEAGGPPKKLDTIEGGSYLLSVHYAERREGPAPRDDTCDCELPEYRYVREIAVFTLQKTPGASCGEDKCKELHPCSSEPDACDIERRHRYFCAWSATRDDDDPTRLDPVDDLLCIARERAPLAVVEVGARDAGSRCDPVSIVRISDQCGPRRIVKSNDLLYDLSRGCDLTRITEIGWMKWHKGEDEMPFSVFLAACERGSRLDIKESETSFTVKFSRDIQVACLRRGVVTMTALVPSRGKGWRTPRRVPIASLAPRTDQQENDPLTTNALKLIFKREWIDDELNHDNSMLNGKSFDIEIEIHGDRILDCHGVPVDANAFGRQALIGNGTPGGTFRSCFRVGAKPGTPDD
jgi:hypothetical protein